MTSKIYTAQEAVGEAWASIDGKLDEFRSANQTVMDGHRDGYLSDAESLIERTSKRGWVLVPVGREDALHAGRSGGRGMMDLKTCPFCTGRVAMMPPEREGDGWFVCCENHDTCPTPCILCPTRELAVEAWNIRPREDALTEEVEALRAALEIARNGVVACRPALEYLPENTGRDGREKAAKHALDTIDAALKGKDQ